MTDNTAFIDHLIALAEPDGDRGPLAILRRGASGETRDLARLYPLVLPWVPRERDERAYIETACLFGAYPTAPRDRSRALGLGRALWRYYQDTGSRQSVEARFIALLRSNRDELVDHLRHAVSLIKDTQLPLLWVDILSALQRWDQAAESDQSPQRQWAREFWGFSKSAGQPPEAEHEPSKNLGVAT